MPRAGRARERAARSLRRARGGAALGPVGLASQRARPLPLGAARDYRELPDRRARVQERCVRVPPPRALHAHGPSHRMPVASQLDDRMPFSAALRGICCLSSIDYRLGTRLFTLSLTLEMRVL